MSEKPAAAKKSARKRTKGTAKKAAKRAKPAMNTVSAAAAVSPTKPAVTPTVKPTPKAGESDITRTLEEIKKRFLEKCPRCSSAMKNTFINLGPNQRLLVNQCKVCKFYLPA